MGLQGSVNDCSSESVLVLFIAIVATSTNYLRSILLIIYRFAGITRTSPVHEELSATLGSGLAGLIVLTEQLNMNRDFSHRVGPCEFEPAGSKCLVCLSKMREGDRVRRLECCHVFHKDCFDRWLDGLNFSCPLCRSPLVEESRRHVRHDLLGFAW